jgi:hypothetical protein
MKRASATPSAAFTSAPRRLSKGSQALNWAAVAVANGEICVTSGEICVASGEIGSGLQGDRQ